MNVNQPSQAEEMPTPVKAFTKKSQKLSNVFLFKQRKVPFVFSTALIHSFSLWCFMIYHVTMYMVMFCLCLSQLLMCFSTDLWQLFSPGWFAQQSFRKRGVCQATCSEFNRKKPNTLQKPDSCTSYLRRRTFNWRENWEFRSLDYTAPLRLKYDWDGLYPHDGAYFEIKI